MQTSTLQLEESPKGQVLIPLIRAAATIGFSIAPCSLGFVIIAVSEHLIRSIMVGDDPYNAVEVRQMGAYFLPQQRGDQLHDNGYRSSAE